MILLFHGVVDSMVLHLMDIVFHVLLVRQEIDVQVDAQLASLSVIIGIALPTIGRMALFVLVRIVILLQKSS